tara:strand:+ start:2470 stop:3558 length:1089 start_codon:yes stop_codon:yes gene_type:complete
LQPGNFPHPEESFRYLQAQTELYCRGRSFSKESILTDSAKLRSEQERSSKGVNVVEYRRHASRVTREGDVRKDSEDSNLCRATDIIGRRGEIDIGEEEEEIEREEEEGGKYDDGLEDSGREVETIDEGQVEGSGFHMSVDWMMRFAKTEQMRKARKRKRRNDELREEEMGVEENRFARQQLHDSLFGKGCATHPRHSTQVDKKKRWKVTQTKNKVSPDNNKKKNQSKQGLRQPHKTKRGENSQSSNISSTPRTLPASERERQIIAFLDRSEGKEQPGDDSSTHDQLESTTHGSEERSSETVFGIRGGEKEEDGGTSKAREEEEKMETWLRHLRQLEAALNATFDHWNDNHKPLLWPSFPMKL